MLTEINITMDKHSGHISVLPEFVSVIKMTESFLRKKKDTILFLINTWRLKKRKIGAKVT